jgi:non-homologous end joining protein Ku
MKLYKKRWQAKHPAKLEAYQQAQKTRKAELRRDPNVEDLLNALRSIVQRRMRQAAGQPL